MANIFPSNRPLGRQTSALVGEESRIIRYYLTGDGWQKFLTRLKQLPYRSFDAVRSQDQYFIKATTWDLVVDLPHRTGRDQGFHRYLPVGKYRLGPYAIYIPYKALLASAMDAIHFIPLKCPLAEQDRTYVPRHLHHYAQVESYAKRANPLTYYPSTCWGNFGSIISMTLDVGNIPELFRALHLFLSIQNTNSPLVWSDKLAHIYERIKTDEQIPQTSF
jgi:hypothetical protein